MGKADGLNEAEGWNKSLTGLVTGLISQPFANARTYLSHFKRVSQSRSVEITFTQAKHLCLGLQASKRGAVDDSCSITLVLAVFTGTIESTVGITLVF